MPVIEKKLTYRECHLILVAVSIYHNIPVSLARRLARTEGVYTREGNLLRIKGKHYTLTIR